MKSEAYRNFFRSSPGLYLAIDPRSKVTDVSDGYLRETGLRREDVTGSSLEHLFPFENEKRKTGAYLRAMSNVLAAGARIRARKFGEWEIETTLNHDASKQITGALICIRNISAARSAEQMRNELEALRQSNEQLAMFAMTAAHDIKAPFRTVGNYLSLIEERMGQEVIYGSIRDYFDRIYDARERINTLLDDLLQYSMLSRIERDNLRIDLSKVVDDAISNLEVTIRERRAVIRLEGDFPQMTGSYIQLVQLFQHLISNALKFNDREPVIVISCLTTEKKIGLSVRDNGIGIASKYFKRVFEVFSRLYAQSKYPGTGLGLAICKKIVEQHNGDIRVKESSASGTEIQVTFPV